MEFYINIFFVVEISFLFFLHLCNESLINFMYNIRYALDILIVKISQLKLHYFSYLFHFFLSSFLEQFVFPLVRFSLLHNKYIYLTDIFATRLNVLTLSNFF